MADNKLLILQAEEFKGDVWMLKNASVVERKTIDAGEGKKKRQLVIEYDYAILDTPYGIHFYLNE